MPFQANSATTKLVAAMMPLLMSTYAAAQDASEGLTLEEIVVTATRQATGSQDTALALTAVSGEELLKQGVNNIADLAKVTPSMYVQEGLSAASTRFSLRGVSTQDINFDGQSPIAIYFDDVYQTAMYGLSNQLFDVGRVEVLRGPQGTLFGKNSTGGALSYYAAEPAFAEEGYASFRLADGNQSARSIEGAINTQLVDSVLALRVSAKMENMGNYVRDEFLNRSYGESESQSVRVQLKWTPSDATTVNLSVSANDYDGQAQVFHVKYLPGTCDPGLPNSNGAPFYLCDTNTFTPLPTPETNPDTVALTDMNRPETFWNQGAVLRINQDLGWGNITSITHYKRGRYTQINDGEGAPGDFFDLYGLNKTQQLGEEIRLATDAEKMLSGVVGVYYQHDRFQDIASFASTQIEPIFPGATSVQADYNQATWATNRTTSYALFGKLTYKITDDLSVEAGFRRSDERRRRDGVTYIWFPANFGDPLLVDWTQDNVLLRSPDYTSITNVPPSFPPSYQAQPLEYTVNTWDFTVNYKPMEDMLLFARAARGFRAGGFNGVGFFNPDIPPPFEPEYIKSYELGVKSEYLNNSLRVNATVFHYDYTDQQVATFLDGAARVANAGESSIDGAELEVKALPIRNLELGGSVSYTRAKYDVYTTRVQDKFTGADTDVDYAGNSLVQSPKWTANASAAYTFDVSASYALRASTTWSYRTEVFFDASNDPSLSSPSLTVGNVRLELEPQEGKGLSVAAFVDNLADKRPITYAFGFYPAFESFVYGNGRKYGAELKYAW